MGKRSNFGRNDRDYYPTPYRAVIPLVNYLRKKPIRFSEPCAGDYRLAQHLELNGHICVQASDIEPQDNKVSSVDVFDLAVDNLGGAKYIITNPPWKRDILHKIIEHFRGKITMWLLLDADWMHTITAKPYMEYCDRVVSVGRVKWIEGSKSYSKDSCAWHRFVSKPVKTIFIPRMEKEKVDAYLKKEKLLKEVCDKYDTTPREVRMGGRKAEQVKKRWKVIRELWNTNDFTLSSLARFLYKDHTTIMHALNKEQ